MRGLNPVPPAPPDNGHDDPCEELWRRGALYEEQGQLIAARNCYRELVRWLLDQQQPVPHYLRDRLAQVLTRLRCFPQALLFLQSSRNELEESRGGYGECLIQLRQAQVCLAAADGVSASQFVAQIRDHQGALGLPEPSQHAALAQRIGGLRWGDESAEELALLRAELYYTLARLYGSAGAYTAALAMVERCTGELARSPLPRSFLSAAGLAILGVELYLDCGDLEGAGQALALQARSHDPRWRLLKAWRAGLAGKTGEARRLVNDLLKEELPTAVRLQGIWTQCHLYVLLNRLGLAEELLETTSAALSTTGAEGHWRRRLEGLLQVVHARRSRAARELALPFVPEQVWETAEAEPDEDAAPHSTEPATDRIHERFSDEWARLANRLLLTLQEAGLAAAEQALGALVNHTQRCDSPLLQTRTLYYRALVAYQQGRYQEVQTLLGPALSQTRASGWIGDEWRVATLLGHASAQLGQRAAHERLVLDAAALLKQLGADLDEEDRRYFLLNKGSAQDAYVSARVRALGRPRRLGFFTGQKDRLRLYQEVNCLTGWGVDRHLDPKSADASTQPPEESHFGHQIEAWVGAQLALQSQTRMSPESIDAVSRWLLWRIPKQVAVLHFYVAPEQIHIFLLTRWRILVHSVPVTRVDLDDAVREALRLILREGETGAGGPRVDTKLTQLGKLLDLDWLGGVLPARIERLVIIPHDVLSNVPFAALRLGEQRLCQRFALSYLPNLFWLLPRRQREFRPLRARQYLGVGVQDYPGTTLRSLPGAVMEVRMVAELLGLDAAQAVVLTDGEVPIDSAAGAAQVLAGLQRASWAHLACHGEFDRTAPHHSGFLVRGTGPAQRITLADCQRQDMNQLELAVLASCWSASAAVLPGNEVLCLPTAFLRAGARAVAASLWPVQDEAEQNGAFIKELVLGTQRYGAARGLAEAQRAFLASDQPARRRTFSWASYLLYGNG